MKIDFFSQSLVSRTRALTMDDDAPRSSGRQRSRPVEFWANERATFTNEKTEGGPAITGRLENKGGSVAMPSSSAGSRAIASASTQKKAPGKKRGEKAALTSAKTVASLKAARDTQPPIASPAPHPKKPRRTELGDLMSLGGEYWGSDGAGRDRASARAPHATAAATASQGRGGGPPSGSAKREREPGAKDEGDDDAKVGRRGAGGTSSTSQPPAAPPRLSRAEASPTAKREKGAARGKKAVAVSVGSPTHASPGARSRAHPATSAAAAGLSHGGSIGGRGSGGVPNRLARGGGKVHAAAKPGSSVGGKSSAGGASGGGDGDGLGGFGSEPTGGLEWVTETEVSDWPVARQVQQAKARQAQQPQQAKSQQAQQAQQQAQPARQARQPPQQARDAVKAGPQLRVLACRRWGRDWQFQVSGFEGDSSTRWVDGRQLPSEVREDFLYGNAGSGGGGGG